MPRLAEHIFELLHEKGVQHAFGIPGDFALSLYDALAESELKPVVMTHEPCVGFAADAYSRIRGLGLAVVTYGVGALNMVNAVAQAYAEKSPLVILSGAPGTRERREHELLHHKVKTLLRAMGHEGAAFVNIAQLDYAGLAKVLGGIGFKVETVLDLKEALFKARDASDFCLLDVRLHPDDVSPALRRLGELFARMLRG